MVNIKYNLYVKKYLVFIKFDFIIIYVVYIIKST